LKGKTRIEGFGDSTQLTSKVAIRELSNAPIIGENYVFLFLMKLRTCFLLWNNGDIRTFFKGFPVNNPALPAAGVTYLYLFSSTSSIVYIPRALDI